MNAPGRQTLQKCDAKRPCTRCVMSNVAPTCEYEIIGAPPSRLDHPQFVLWSEPDSSALKGVSSRECCAVGDTIVGSSAEAQVAPIIVSATGLAHPLGDNNSLSSGTAPRMHGLNQVKKHLPSLTILPPFSELLSRIPPQPHITLLLLGAEQFRLSDATLRELDMKLSVSRFFWS